MLPQNHAQNNPKLTVYELETTIPNLPTVTIKMVANKDFTVLTNLSLTFIVNEATKVYLTTTFPRIWTAGGDALTCHLHSLNQVLSERVSFKSLFESIKWGEQHKLRNAFEKLVYPVVRVEMGDFGFDHIKLWNSHLIDTALIKKDKHKDYLIYIFGEEFRLYVEKKYNPVTKKHNSEEQYLSQSIVKKQQAINFIQQLKNHSLISTVTFNNFNKLINMASHQSLLEKILNTTTKIKEEYTSNITTIIPRNYQLGKEIFEHIKDLSEWEDIVKPGARNDKKSQHKFWCQINVDGTYQEQYEKLTKIAHILIEKQFLAKEHINVFLFRFQSLLNNPPSLIELSLHAVNTGNLLKTKSVKYTTADLFTMMLQTNGQAEKIISTQQLQQDFEKCKQKCKSALQINSILNNKDELWQLMTCPTVHNLLIKIADGPQIEEKEKVKKQDTNDTAMESTQASEIKNNTSNNNNAVSMRELLKEWNENSEPEEHLVRKKQKFK